MSRDDTVAQGLHRETGARADNVARSVGPIEEMVTVGLGRRKRDRCQIIHRRTAANRAPCVLSVGDNGGNGELLVTEMGGGGSSSCHRRGSRIVNLRTDSPVVEHIAVCRCRYQGGGGAAQSSDLGGVDRIGNLRMSVSVSIGELHRAPVTLSFRHVGAHHIIIDAEECLGGHVVRHGECQQRLGRELVRGLRHSEVAESRPRDGDLILIQPAVDEMQGHGIGRHRHLRAVTHRIGVGPHLFHIAGKNHDLRNAYRDFLYFHTTPLFVVDGQGENRSGSESGGEGGVLGDSDVPNDREIAVQNIVVHL